MAHRYALWMVARTEIGGLWEEAEDVLALARTCGYELSRDQLRRWHRSSVVDRPVQVARGVHGTVTMYPPGTASLVLEACGLLASGACRLERVAWELWWRGLTEPRLAARGYLAKQAGAQVEILRHLVDEHGELSEDAAQVLNDAEIAPVSKPLRRIRRRVGSENFGLVLEALFAVARGRVDELGTGTLTLLEHAMGMDRARTDIVASIGEPWLAGEVREDMENISSLASPERMLQLVDAVGDDELEVARDEVMRFAVGLSDISYVMRKTIDGWAFGMAAWGINIEELLGVAEGQAQLMLIWMSCKDAGLGPGMARILESMESLTDVRERLDTLLALGAAVPAVAEAVPVSWLGRAMGDPTYQEKIQVAFAEVRKTHGREIDAFLSSRRSGHRGGSHLKCMRHVVSLSKPRGATGDAVQCLNGSSPRRVTGERDRSFRLAGDGHRPRRKE